MVGKNILIVDDEAPIREMIAVALEMAGYECLEAENTQQAHAIIVDRKPDLILLDWMLPGIDGLRGRLRLTEQFPDNLLNFAHRKLIFFNLLSQQYLLSCGQGQHGTSVTSTQPVRSHQLLHRLRQLQKPHDIADVRPTHAQLTSQILNRPAESIQIFPKCQSLLENIQVLTLQILLQRRLRCLPVRELNHTTWNSLQTNLLVWFP